MLPCCHKVLGSQRARYLKDTGICSTQGLTTRASHTERQDKPAQQSPATHRDCLFNFPFAYLCRCHGGAPAPRSSGVDSLQSFAHRSRTRVAWPWQGPGTVSEGLRGTSRFVVILLSSWRTLRSDSWCRRRECSWCWVCLEPFSGSAWGFRRRVLDFAGCGQHVSKFRRPCTEGGGGT